MANNTATAPSAASRALLRVLRKPEKVISRIEETCSIEDDDFVRRISLTYEGKPSMIDLLRPRKGVVGGLRLTGDSLGLRQLSHTEHVRASQDIISYRFLSVIKSARIRTQPTRDFQDRLSAALDELLRIPELGPEEALKILDSHFVSVGAGDRSGINLKLLSDAGITVLDVEQVQGLYRLCQMLSQRYLVLVEVVNKGSTRIDYEYRHSVSELDPGGKKSRGKFRKLYRGFFGEPPTSIRVHVPLAKRTDHYSLSLAPQEDYFIHEIDLLEGDSDKENAVDLGRMQKDVVSTIRWATGGGWGRACQAYVSHGPVLERRLYIGAQVRELPGRSTFRSAALLILASILFVGVLPIAQLGTARSIDAASVTVGLLSVLSLWVQSSMPRVGLHGAPILARTAATAVSILGILFCIWLLAKDYDFQPMGDDVHHPLRHLVENVWSTVQEWGGIAVTAVTFCFALHVIRRCFHLARAYSDVRANSLAKHNFHTTPEGQ